MDRAGKKRPDLTLDEAKSVFEIVGRGGDLEEARSLLLPRSRIMVTKVYNVAVEFRQRALQQIDDETSQIIAERAKYDCTPSYVQRLFLFWLAWRTGSPALVADLHQEELPKELERLATPAGKGISEEHKSKADTLRVHWLDVARSAAGFIERRKAQAAYGRRDARMLWLNPYDAEERAIIRAIRQHDGKFAELEEAFGSYLDAGDKGKALEIAHEMEVLLKEWTFA